MSATLKDRAMFAAADRFLARIDPATVPATSPALEGDLAQCERDSAALLQAFDREFPELAGSSLEDAEGDE